MTKIGVDKQNLEQALVCAIVRYPEYTLNLVRGLDPRDVQNETARALVEAFQVVETGNDALLVDQAIDLSGLSLVTFSAYLEEARKVDVEQSSIGQYIERIREASRADRAISVLNGGITRLTNNESYATVASDVAGKLRDLYPESSDGGIGEALSDLIDDVSLWHEHPLPPGEVRGLSTGFSALDDLLDGLEASLVLCGARPSVGKTALWSKIALNAAVNQKRAGKTAPIVYHTNEMSAKQLLSRLTGAIVGADRREVRAGRLDDDTLAEYVQTAAWMSELPLEIHCTMHISGVVARAYREPRPAMIIVDYLNKMTGGEGENRNQRFGSIASTLFEISGEVGISVPVVLLAQLNRDLKNRSGGALPVMEDLRDSGELEQLADVILMLHRHTDETSDAYDPHRLIVIKRKDRLGGGQDGSAHLFFDTRFGNVIDIS